MKIGIIGLPNAGKSTIFNALSEAGAEVKKHPFTTIEPNVGMVPVPDPRLNRLAEIFSPERLIPATIKFVDIAGLVEGASRGEGMGNQFLAAIRETDALVQTVRCFADDTVAHVMGEADAVQDIETVRTELLLADLETVERRLEKLERGRSADPRAGEEERELLETLRDRLGAGIDCREDSLVEKLGELSPDLGLFTLKPAIYLANTGEENSATEQAILAALREKARGDGVDLIEIPGLLEAEVAGLEAADREAFREELGLKRSGLERLVFAAKKALGLVTFFTKEGVEVRAWMIPAGTPARTAAGAIHSDMEEGFIRAEVAAFEVLDRAGSLAEVKQQGELRTEGRDYPVQEGDVIRFLFKL